MSKSLTSTRGAIIHAAVVESIRSFAEIVADNDLGSDRAARMAVLTMLVYAELEHDNPVEQAKYVGGLMGCLANLFSGRAAAGPLN